MRDHGEIARAEFEIWLDNAKRVYQGDSIRHDSILRSMEQKWEMASQHETMYWLFSTAAQVVATIIGLLIMCVIFRRGQVKSGDTASHWVASVAMVVAAIAIAYDFYMIYKVPSELIAPCHFSGFVLLNLLPILLASYSVWAYLK